MGRTLDASSSKHSCLFYGENCEPIGPVLRAQFYLSSLPLGAHQEETGILFWLPTKSKLLDFNITVLNLCSPSGN